MSCGFFCLFLLFCFNIVVIQSELQLGKILSVLLRELISAEFVTKGYNVLNLVWRWRKKLIRYEALVEL